MERSLFWKAWGAVVLLCCLVAAASAFTIDGHTFAVGQGHTLSNAGAELTYYQLKFTLSNATGDSTGSTIYTDGLTAADWRDLRWTSGTDGVYSHWIESTNATAAVCWVNVTSIPSGTSTIRLYYDSDTAPASSNGTATFPLYDGFSGSSINPAIWSTYTSGVGSVAVSNGVATLTAGTGQAYISSASFGNGYAVRSNLNYTANNYKHYWGFSGAANYALFYPDQPNNGAFVVASWNGASVEQTSITGYTTTMTIYEVARTTTPSNLYFVNDVLKDTDTARAKNEVAAAMLYVLENGAVLNVDWALVRKYNVTEPTHGAYTTMSVPVAAFSADVTSGDMPLAVQFTDASTGSPTAWAWDFDGDGDTDSTDQNPSHEYPSAGTYTVVLNASTAYGFDLETKAAYIMVSEAYDPPVAAFSANDTSGYAPLAVALTDSSANVPTAWAWDVTGPNGYTNEQQTQNIVLTLTDPGTYTVSLQVTNPAGADIEEKVNYITVLALPDAPVANFAANHTSGSAPFTVAFTDTSAGATSWAWDFDGDAVADSTDQNPVYTFAANGTYTVTLQVSNDGGTDTETKTGYIYVGDLTATYLKPSFRYSTAIGDAPLSVTFTDTTWTGDAGGTYARLWSFGDGNTSTEANPTHVYTDAGKFDVELRVTSDTRSAATRIAKAVMVYPDQAAAPIATTTFGVHATELAEANFDPQVYGETLPKAYTDLMPISLVWGIIFLGAFAMLFIRQGSVTIILIMGILIGGAIWVLLPPEWNLLGQGMAGLCMAGFLFTLFTGRRK